MPRLGWISALALACALVAAPVFGQGGGGTATLSGVVTDKDGGLVPGATVVIKNAATGEALPPAVTNAQGAYSFPGLTAGTYTVSISLQGFKKIDTKVTLVAGTTNTVTSKLEVGNVTEIVNVTAGSDLVRTATPTVTQTVSSDLIQKLPRGDRNVMSFMLFMPGVQTVGGGNYRANTTVAGLPVNTTNITIDGVNTGNLLFNSDGFYSLITPRIDAVEEVSLTTASGGADSSGSGAVQIKFVTRSGTNKFETSGYAYIQHANLNSNTWGGRNSGLTIPAATNYTYGGRIGGPIILPGFDGRGRAFFFFNWEEFTAPAEIRRSATMPNQSIIDGVYSTYSSATGVTSTVNIMEGAKAYAAANGIPASAVAFDPTVLALFNQMRGSIGKLGSVLEETVNSPNVSTLRWNSPVDIDKAHNPTTNITVNLTSKHRLQGAYYLQRYNRNPDTLNTADPRFPEFPITHGVSSWRETASFSLRSTLSTSMVNEARVGFTYTPFYFSQGVTKEMFNEQSDGYALNYSTNWASSYIPFFANLANNGGNGSASPLRRFVPTMTISNSLSWLKGAHSFTFGGALDSVTGDESWKPINQYITLGFSSTFDPLEPYFANAANFPTVMTANNRNSARSLFASLTGRVSVVGGRATLNDAGTEFVYNGQQHYNVTQRSISAYAQDQWRYKPNVTFTLGVRYQLTLPMTAGNGIFTAITLADSCGKTGVADYNSPSGYTLKCNMFNPGSFLAPDIGAPIYSAMSSATKGYDIDFNNFAPNLGVSWRPNVQDGWLRALLGDPEMATINAGYSRSFNVGRIEEFTNIYYANPGQALNVNRATSSGNFPLVGGVNQNGPDSGVWPILFSQRDRLEPPLFDPKPTTPITAAYGDGAWLFDPTVQTPYTDSWTVGLQRAVTKDTVVEVRYQGNTNRLAWTRPDLNSVNMYNSGTVVDKADAFYNRVDGGEYAKAVANLQANLKNGKGATFAYTGVDGTSPLPIVLAHFDGKTDASNPASYTSTTWTSSTFTNWLNPYGPAPGNFATNLATSSNGYFTRAQTTGLYPSNYWRLSETLQSVNMTTNSIAKPYSNQVIIQVRRRLSEGLVAQVGYTWSRSYSQSLPSSGDTRGYQLPLLTLQNAGIPNNITALWAYDIPVGRGKRYGANMNAVLDGFVGGWTFSGSARFQTQAFFLRDTKLSDDYSIKEAQKDLGLVRFLPDPVSGVTQVYNFPEEIRVQTLLAYNNDENQVGYYSPGTEPSGKYFMPVSGPGCMVVYTHDCGAQDLYFRGRWFGEMDFRLAKAFQLPGRARFEFSGEVFNATKAINFPNTINPTNNDAFHVGGGQSSARTAQLVFRVNW